MKNVKFLLKVAEWMGKREAWPTDKSCDPRTKSTRWEFRNGREQFDESVVLHSSTAVGGGVVSNDSISKSDSDNRRKIRSADEQQRRVKIRYEIELIELIELMQLIEILNLEINALPKMIPISVFTIPAQI